MKKETSLSDRNLESMMGQLLRYGVLLSAVLVTAGAVVYLSRYGAEKAVYGVFAGEPQRFIRVGDIVHGALHASGRSLIQLGILVLIATPIARILFSVIGFILEKDRLYILITLVVLSIIIISLLTGD